MQVVIKEKLACCDVPILTDYNLLQSDKWRFLDFLFKKLLENLFDILTWSQQITYSPVTVNATYQLIRYIHNLLLIGIN